jgi:hypothetical protein
MIELLFDQTLSSNNQFRLQNNVIKVSHMCSVFEPIFFNIQRLFQNREDGLYLHEFIALPVTGESYFPLAAVSPSVPIELKVGCTSELV